MNAHSGGHLRMFGVESPFLALLGALSVLLAILAAAPPSHAATQEEWSSVRIPASTEQALREVERALRRYYQWWLTHDPLYNSTARFRGDRYGSCFAEQGDRCYPEPWGGCSPGTNGRCKTLEERARFSQELRNLALDHPDSPLALTQAVYAAIRLGFPGIAEELIKECEPSETWWCDLASGHFLHRSGRSPHAHAFLLRALEAMPRDLRQYLEDIAPLLLEADQKWYRGLPPDERAEFHARFWWQADPFFGDDGNDRWTEHIVRRLERALYASCLIALYGSLREKGVLSPADDEFVRRGWRDSFHGVQWTVAVRGGWEPFTSKKAAYNHFVPDSFSVTGLTEGLTYRLDAAMDDEGYTRSSGPVVQLPSQVARFREGDSLLVAMASDLALAGVYVETEEPGADAGDPSGPGGGVSPQGQVHFVTSRGPDDVAFFDPAPVREKVALAGQVPNQIQLIGVEVFLPAVQARGRQVLLPLEPAERLLSDLLLFRPMGPELPDTRMTAVALMHGSDQVPRDLELGVYWEGYGFPAADSVGVSVRLRGEEGGWLWGLGRALRLVGEVHEGALTWREPAGEVDPFTRAITLNVSGLDEGNYQLVLSMELEDGTVLERSRTFRVVEGGGG